MKEVWKDITGLEGLFQISNFGRLKNVKNGYIRKSTNKKGGYFSVVLTDSNGNDIHTRIHRLVAQAFIGEIPKGYQVHHIDGNKQNNRIDNLEILSPSEHARKSMIQNPNRTKGMNYYNQFVRPLKVRQYTLEGEFVAEYANSEIAHKITGVCQRNILHVANKKEGRKQAGGYIWKFVEREGVV